MPFCSSVLPDVLLVPTGHRTATAAPAVGHAQLVNSLAAGQIRRLERGVKPTKRRSSTLLDPSLDVVRRKRFLAVEVSCVQAKRFKDGVPANVVGRFGRRGRDHSVAAHAAERAGGAMESATLKCRFHLAITTADNKPSVLK